MASSSPPPFSSSPADFMFTSSPVSELSAWSRASEESTATASTSASVGLDRSAPDDQFTRRLHELLLLVIREREDDDLKRRLKWNGDGSECSSSSPASGTSHDSSYDIAATDTDTTHHTPAAANTPNWPPSPPQDAYMQTTPPSSDFPTEPHTESSLSTLVFASPASDFASPIKPPRPAPRCTYRIIHRASSYLPARRGHDSSPSPCTANVRTEPGMHPPPRKRPKILTRTATHTSIRTELARAPASTRRAASLRSLPDDHGGGDEGQGAGGGDVKEQHVLPPAGDVPTAPATPVPVPESAEHGARTGARPGLWHVPIIAPPPVLPPAPVLDEPPACVRVKRLLEREAVLRAEMGLARDGEGCAGAGAGLARWDWDWDWDDLGLGEELRGRVVRWILEVVPPVPSGSSGGRVGCSSESEGSEDDGSSTGNVRTCPISSTSSTASSNSSTSTSTSTSTSAHTASSNTSTSTSISTNCTTTGLTPTPRITFCSPATFSPSSSTSSSTCSTPYSPPAPRPQSGQSILLKSARAARDVAGDTVSCGVSVPAVLLGRAVPARRGWGGDRVGVEGMAKEKEKEKEEEERFVFGAELDAEGRVLVTWDIAVACLALSVKHHRDFLHPLFPVSAFEFQRLAPHVDAGGPLSYEDLEIAHRDVSAALAWRLGDTPQALLSEVWAALPALRRLLRGEGGEGDEKDGGEIEPEWNCAQRETWRVLFYGGWR
ncbi:hypothetical protein LshimejAT787_4800020 [Lyophyllum shimeji]|uniref:Uncharacterized protein n=1 Tax=Lyophyllum shimeji TaxID=47721 RepID=A0A9P3US82_LYOSH|nr:hypothetical protein LshimejAT787_4800020 [Lyophyllum shimeji]